MVNKTKENKKRFFYPDEFDAMFQHLNKNGKFTAKFDIQTGGRINELRGFVKNPIFESLRNNIVLTDTKVRSKLGESKPEARTLPLGNKYFKELKSKIKTHRVLSTNAFNIQLRKACEKANKTLRKDQKIKNVEEFSSHNIRKTFATWMLSLGISPSKVAQHLGHTEKVLLKDYATNDVFNSTDKDRMIQMWGELPKRLLPDRRLLA